MGCASYTAVYGGWTLKEDEPVTEKPYKAKPPIMGRSVMELQALYERKCPELNGAEDVAL